MNSATLAHPAGFPAFALPVLGSRERQIGAAVAVSLLIHGVALGWLPGLTRQTGEALPPLQVRLSAPAVRPDAFAVAPAPTLAPAPRPNRPDAMPLQRQVTPQLVAVAPEAVPETPALRVAEAPAAASTDVVRPTVAPALAPAPAPPPAPDAGMLAAYGRELAGAVAARQRYPRLAQLRQWQGIAVLQLDLAAAGGLLAVRVLSSSGHEILDQQALEMVRAALPLPALPAALAGRRLTVDVPVVFRLAS
ncbi:MAG: hypothetical protein A3H93_03585 [Rhodocyclales bacterium RIFCSPLOWO2_02_FULL_63_24]|nr:MAG: hypothetical protein A2040_07930 [Rhodocyclales bacterium GWA2_65_19]OHC67961.1 MAG: hypothetical protein A3H93_03585 [Rhodocyclales bacterium RIFCSPLOWO2_02_FULL_63_24]